MVNREMVVEMLRTLGVNAKEVDKSTGSVTLHGIAIEPKDGNKAWPALYLEDMPDDMFEVLEMLTFDADEFLDDPEWVLKNVYIGLRTRTPEGDADNIYVASHPFGEVDIDKYYYVRFNEEYTTKLTKDMVHNYAKDCDNFMSMLRVAAENNTFNKTVINNLGGMFGAEDNAAWVVTNEDTLLGASAILDPDVVSFCKARHIKKVAILPSSIHEMIMFDYDKADMTYDNLVQMIKGGNELNEPRDILADELVIFIMDYVGDSFGR